MSFLPIFHKKWTNKLQGSNRSISYYYDEHLWNDVLHPQRLRVRQFGTNGVSSDKVVQVINEKSKAIGLSDV